MRRFRKSSATKTHFFKGQHRFEHWYRDNTFYFITSRCRDRFAAFETESAKSVFWDRYNHYTVQYGFHPAITTLMDNHYHAVGFLEVGSNLGPLMQKLHGSIAKLVNDQLPRRHLPFWRTLGNRDYFDGCLRDEQQLRRAYRYTLNQSIRARLVSDVARYPHTKIGIDLEGCSAFAKTRQAFLSQVPYQRHARQAR